MQGKTWLTALYCCCRSILYPGTKIVVTSGTLKQANEVLLKIQDDFMHKSPMLRNEILKCNIGQNDATISFKNGSWIKTRTSTANSRSARANTLIVDEFRMVDENVLTTVLQQFLTSPRQPAYLNKPEYSHLVEENKEIYMSSAWFKSSWAYKKVQGYTVNLFNEDLSYFLCGLPYQLSMYEGLLSRKRIEAIRSEPNYNEYTEGMELECLWMGDDGDALFQYEDLDSCRTLKNAFLPLKFYNDRFKVPKLRDTERRIMSVDIAVMGSKKGKNNDATSIFINSLVRVDDLQYHSNFVFADTFEGMRADDQALTIMRYFYKYNCTDLVVDATGVGQPIVDLLMKDQYDSYTGETYKALTCINNDAVAERCNVQDANKCMWAVKASSEFNSQIAASLRTGFLNGKISLLVNENQAEEILSQQVKGYDRKSATDKIALQSSYLQTTMAIFELIKLEHEFKGDKLKVKEQSGMRKDRYSSIAYNYWCACELERQLKPKNQSTEDLIQAFAIRKAKHF